MLDYEVEMYNTFSSIFDNFYYKTRYARSMMHHEGEIKLIKSIGRPYELNSGILTDNELLKLMPADSYVDMGEMFYLYNCPLFKASDLPEEYADIHTIYLDKSFTFKDKDIIETVKNIKVNTDAKGMVLDFRNENTDILDLFAETKDNKNNWNIASNEVNAENISTLFDSMVFEDYKDIYGAWLTNEDNSFHILTNSGNRLVVDLEDTTILENIRQELGYDTIFVFANNTGKVKTRNNQIVIY